MHKLVNFIKNNKLFLLGSLVLSWVIFINLFPEGYIISSTDTSQIINIKDNLWRYFFVFPSWFLYLLFLKFLGYFATSDTFNLTLTLGFLIFGSYLSFYLFVRLFFKKSDLLIIIFSLLYALNIFTLYTLTMHGLGYTPFYYLYIFIPLLTGFFIKFLQTQKYIYLIYFSLILFLASVGFCNPAFLLGFILVLFFLLIFLILTKQIIFSKILLFNLLLITLFSFLVSAFWIFPVIPAMRVGVETLNTTNPTELLSTLIGDSNKISDTLGLNNSFKHFFPNRFQYGKILFLKNTFLFLTYLPIIILILCFIFLKNFNNKKLYFLALFIIILLIMGVAKLIPPFETLNYFIFVKIWGMNTLRASDKLFIFLPFFLFLALYIVFSNLYNKGYKKILYLCLFLFLITPLPFYLGKLQQTVGSRLSIGKNYKTSKLTFLVKIPKEYYAIKNFFTHDNQKYYVAILPRNLGDSGTGSSNFPKWKLS